MAWVVVDRRRLAGSSLLALAAGACSLSAPTMAEYASVSSSTAGFTSAGSGAAGLGQGEPPTDGGGIGGGGGALIVDGGAADDAGSAGDPGVGGRSGTAGGPGTAGAMSIAGSTGTAGDTASAGSTGAAGSGGSAGSLQCSDHPLSSRWKWVASASKQYTPASSVLDGSSSRWSTGQAQSGNEWLQIDFGSTVSIRRVNLQQGEYTNDYPRNYVVYVSDTSRDSSGPVRASGVGTSDVTTTIVLPKTVAGRYLFIKQVGSSLSWWSVEEVEVCCFDG